jgi:Zn ribbon nucleic-acid-binding protein
MASRAARQFNAEVSRLFKARTHKLRSTIWPTRGREPRVSRSTIRETISKLQTLAEKALLSSQFSRKIFRGYDYKKQWHAKKGKGHGRTEKRKSFKQWYENHIKTQNCVYVFWQGQRCLYVGRTLNGQGRPTTHFERYWFGRASRVDVHGFERKRDVPRFECMLTHRYHPVYSRMKPSSKKYYTRCPVCEANKKIQVEVEKLFRLR